MPTEMKEFDDLIAALQAERPKIDPGFARELDQRAAAGFAKPRRRPRLTFLTRGFAPALAVGCIFAVVVSAAVISGGGAGDDDGDAATSGGSVAVQEEAVPQPQADVDASVPEAARAGGDAALNSAWRDKAPGTAAVGNGRRGRLQELSADLTLVAPARDVAKVGDEILRVTDDLGGFVVSSSVSSTDGAGSGGGGEFQLRIPTDRLDQGIAQLSRLAHVRERTQGVLDITSERNVARERLEEARAERVSLLQRLEEADTEYEAEALKAQIASINDAIGRYRADLRRVVRRAHFAAVNVSLLGEGEDGEIIPGDGQWTPGDALRDAGRVLEVIAGVFVVAAAVLLPLALLLVAIGLTRRALGRRGRERVLDAV